MQNLGQEYSDIVVSVLGKDLPGVQRVEDGLPWHWSLHLPVDFLKKGIFARASEGKARSQGHRL